MYKTYWVNPELLDMYWGIPEVQKYLHRTYSVYSDSLPEDKLRSLCLDGKALLFIQELDGIIIFAGVATFSREKGVKTKVSGKKKRRKLTILNVIHGSGKDFEIDFDQLDVVFGQMANVINADIIRVKGRAGWRKHTRKRGYTITNSYVSSFGKVIKIYSKEV